MTSATLTSNRPDTLGAALKVILLSESGRQLTSERVLDADYTHLRSEAWLECFLRKGMPGVAYADAAFQVTPILRADSETVCAGFALESDTPRGQVARCEFPTRALLEVASRGAERLLKFGVLQPGDKYQFHVVVDPEPRPTAAGPQDVLGTMRVTNPPLYFLSVPLRPLLQDGRAVDDLDEQSIHVFYTEAAFADSESLSRKGAGGSNPVETGAALVGFLCLANDTVNPSDFFLVVTDALEVVNSENTEVSLTYTSESWSRISRIMNARQSVQPACRFAGSAHSHAFSPGRPCASCFTTAAPCGLHNVAPSSQDLLWTTSVFAHQPWALCHIFGTNARGEALNGLFTLRHGRLHRRGFYLLPWFDPGRWERICNTDLSGHEHKYDDVRGKGFFGQTRRERRAYPKVDL